jgi:hypothetical protein
MKIEEYRRTLHSLPDWTSYLKEHSGLPGPRGNLELAHAAAQADDPARLEPYLALGPELAPENTPEVFLAFCGVLWLGVRLARNEPGVLPHLKAFANDPRWRIREAAATALQTWGDTDLLSLLAEMARWAQGSAFEQRAAVAALCEPRLLREEIAAMAALRVLDGVTAGVEQAHDRRSDGFIALRKALGYGWSVAIAASPAAGQAAFERWAASADREVRWVLRENLKKNRLQRIDPAWVEAMGKSLT